MSFNGERLKQERKKKGMTQWDLAERLHVVRPTITMWETGKNAPTADMLSELAELFDCTTDYLLGRTEDMGYLPSNVCPISSLPLQRVPLIGSVAAGEPIYDPEELGVYVDAPVGADAAITIRGDSMEPTYLDGDVVYIKCCPDVPEGAVAVVFLDDEAMIKHIYKRPTGLTLWSDNPAHMPIQIEYADYNNVRIFGVPVGFTRIYKPSISGKIKKGF